MKRASFAVGLTSLVAAPAVRAEEPIVLKFSHVLPAATPKGKAALRFKELAERYTSGRVRVEVFPNSTLYKDAEEMEALVLGAVQMLAPSTQKFAPLGVRQFEVLDLPFLFPDQATYDRAIGGELGKGLLSRLKSKGVLGFTFWDNGFLIISANRPLIKPADLRGLKIRISGSKIDDQSLRLMGANPQVMAFSELYQALQTGVVDGAQQPASNYTTQRLQEVQKYMTTLYHMHLQYAVIVNQKFWEGLPEDVRAQLDRALAEATAYNNAIAAQDNADALATIRAGGHTEIHDPSPAERAVWREALQPVYASAGGRIGADVVAEALKAVAAASK